MMQNRRLFVVQTLACWALLSQIIGVHADDKKVSPGQLLYQKQCLRCHGPQGEGVKKKYASPLEGDKSVQQLTKQIQKTMPEDAPESLSAEEAEQVAKYIHEAFYSKIARERNRPARIDLARLTVRQYKLAVADVIGHKLGKGWFGDQRGIKGDYFGSKHWRNEKKAFDRVDETINFDFETKAPVYVEQKKGEEKKGEEKKAIKPNVKIEDYEFYIHWFGGILASETGWHDIIVQSNQAVKLHFNDDQKPVIDAWVKSGNDTEYKASVYLIAGKVYPIKLEFSKANQGVDDKKDKKEKAPPRPAFVRLMWKPPSEVVHVIPATNLTPSWFPETYAVTTPFPADDRSYGWERGSTISKEWDAATTDAAIDAANYVVNNIDMLTGVKEKDKERDKKIKNYCASFLETAYRRPLSKEEKTKLIDQPFEKSKNIDLLVKRLVLRAAASGKLKTREQVQQQAWRMIGDERAKAKVAEFFQNWLKLNHVTDLAKDPKRYPGFNGEIIHDLRTSLDLFLRDIIWSEKSNFKELLLSDDLYLNDRLAKFYGQTKKDAKFTKVKLNPEHRAGVLTHPYLMSSFAYVGETSPIHRGVFLARGVLGLTLRPPQEAFTPLPADLHPTLSTRERVSLQTKPQACMSCHTIINPLGFTMENFDAVGRFREKENGKLIDATGSYFTRSGQQVSFQGVRELAQFLANSPEVHEAFVEQLFQHLVKQPVRAYSSSKRKELTDSFTGSGFHVKNLIVHIATDAALQGRPTGGVAKK
jgi:cytochrome c553